MRGNKILVGTPRGKFFGGIISGTPKPGTCMEMTTAAAQGGRDTWQASTTANGVKREIVVLLDDPNQGFKFNVAYVAGTWGQLYAPYNGDELNMLLADVGGTSPAFTKGDKLGVSNAGVLLADNSFATTPFEALETIAAVDSTPSTWLFVRFRGDYA